MTRQVKLYIKYPYTFYNDTIRVHGRKVLPLSTRFPFLIPKKDVPSFSLFNTCHQLVLVLSLSLMLRPWTCKLDMLSIYLTLCFQRYELHRLVSNSVQIVLVVVETHQTSPSLSLSIYKSIDQDTPCERYDRTYQSLSHSRSPRSQNKCSILHPPRSTLTNVADQ